MKALLLLLLAIHAASASSYKRYTDYREYINAWLKIVPKRYVHDVSDLALNGQTCYAQKCQYFYFEYEDPSHIDAVQQRTVLLVSGMHGDEFIGPHTLLYAYPHLKAYRIIYFPMANPSGFIKETRETFPGKVDLNRDFPVDGNTICYQATATRIIDMLFRKYKFDLTVALHNGGSEIGFNWGTGMHKGNSHTQEYDIYRDIAEMLQKEGGESASLGLPKFKVGTMDEVVYSATGTFDDWAYAAGKFPEAITKCNNFPYQEYPQNMANGLVFLFELGPKIVKQLGSQEGIALSPTSNNHNNGFFARAIRMLKALLNVIQPQLDFKHNENALKLSVIGCKTAQITKLVIKKQESNTWLEILELPGALAIQGNVRGTPPTPAPLELKAAVKEGELIKYQGSFECDAEWQGKGTTSFAQPRNYSFNRIQKVQKQMQLIENEQTFKDLAIATVDEVLSSIDLSQYSYQLAAAGIAIVSCLIFGLCKRCVKKKKIEKFEEVEYHPEPEQHTENEDEMGGDLHTARGGIIDM